MTRYKFVVVNYASIIKRNTKNQTDTNIKTHLLCHSKKTLDVIKTHYVLNITHKVCSVVIYMFVWKYVQGVEIKCGTIKVIAYLWWNNPNQQTK